MNRWNQLLFAALVTAAVSAEAAAATPSTLTDDMDVSCAAPQQQHIACDYRLITNPLTAATAVSARVGTVSLPTSSLQPYPFPGSTTAILFLVDTSDPRRERTIERTIRHLEAFAKAVKPYERIGLARFDTNLHVLAPLGSSVAEFVKAAKGLRAVGQTTELYRNTLDAVKLLARYDATRKALFLFSDGLAEDRAYGDEDVTAAARKANIAIYGMGYPQTVLLSVALQTLRRLSDETGGLFISAGTDGVLPEAFLKAPFAAIDSGGRFEVNIEPAISAGMGGPTHLNLSIKQAARTLSVHVPVQLPPAVASETLMPLPVTIATPEPVAAVQAPTQQAAPPEPARPSAPATQPSPPARPSAPAAQPPEPVHAAPARPTPAPAPINPWLWYGIPAAFLLIVVAALVLFAMMIRRRRSEPQPEKDDIPLAYLVRQDDEETRYPITQTTWRIGRGKNNELALADNSVSRQHAEIHRAEDGTFLINDLDSLNGVFVNDRKVKSSKLAEGDLIDIGDVCLRFTLHESDYAAQEPTIMLRTKTPSVG